MKNLLVSGVHFYQRFISPGLPTCCRYYPTCSQYMINVIHTHGSVKGVAVGVTQVLRYHPLVKGDIDYAPLKFRLTKSPGETYYRPYTYRGNRKTEVGRNG